MDPTSAQVRKPPCCRRLFMDESSEADRAKNTARLQELFDDENKRVIREYNFDLKKNILLEGRYEWTPFSAVSREMNQPSNENIVPIESDTAAPSTSTTNTPTASSTPRRNKRKLQTHVKDHYKVVKKSKHSKPN